MSKGKYWRRREKRKFIEQDLDIDRDENKYLFRYIFKKNGVGLSSRGTGVGKHGVGIFDVNTIFFFSRTETERKKGRDHKILEKNTREIEFIFYSLYSSP